MQMFDIMGPSAKNENESLFPSLSYRERLIGFAFCFFMGYFIQILSFGSFLGILAGSPTKFAITYSLGNLLSLFGTAFLTGFRKQFQNMIEKERRITSILFVSSFIMIFVSAYLIKSKILVLIFLIIEFCSYTWYVASYIPFARDCIKGCLRNNCLIISILFYQMTNICLSGGQILLANRLSQYMIELFPQLLKGILVRKKQKAKICKYFVKKNLNCGQKKSLEDEYQYRQIEEENESDRKGQDYKDQSNVTLKDIYKMHVFGEPLKQDQQQWESKNLFHYDSFTPKKSGILQDISPPLLQTYNSLLDYKEQIQSGSEYQTCQRKINKVPFKVLDAPQLQDDFYLNLIDWSSTNVLSVALSSCVYLWSAHNNKVIKFCDFGNNDMVCSLVWAPTGNQLAIGTGSGEIHLYDQQKMKRISVLEGHTARVGSLAWSGNTLCSGSKDRSIILHDPRQKRNTGKFEGHKQEVCGLKWSPDEYQLASGGNDNKLFVWRLGSQIPLAKFSQHQAAVKAIAWSPHRHGLLSSGGGTADRTIRFFNTLTTQQLDWIDTGSQVCNLLFSKNVNEFVSTHGYSMNQIVCWKYPSLEKVTTLMGHTSRVLFLAMSPDGETIVTGAGDETLRFWNVFPKKEESRHQQTVLLPLNIR